MDNKIREILKNGCSSCVYPCDENYNKCEKFNKTILKIKSLISEEVEKQINSEKVIRDMFDKTREEGYQQGCNDMKEKIWNLMSDECINHKDYDWNNCNYYINEEIKNEIVKCSIETCPILNTDKEE